MYCLGHSGRFRMGLDGVGVLTEVYCVSHEGPQRGRFVMAASEVSPPDTVEVMFSTNSWGRFGHPLHRSRTHTELARQPWKRETRSAAVASEQKGVASRVSKEAVSRSRE